MRSRIAFCLTLVLGWRLVAQAPAAKRLLTEITETRRRAIGLAAADAPPVGLGVKRSRLMELNLPLVGADEAKRFSLSMNRPGPPERVELSLFDDVTLTVIMKRIASSRDGKTLIWSGDVEGGRPGTMTLANTAGTVNGQITLTGGAIYELRPVAGRPGVQRVLEIDQRALPRESPPIPVQSPPGVARDQPQALDDGSVVDVMVAYTDSAMEAAGGDVSIRNMIRLAESQMNEGLSASGVLFRVNVVQMVKVSFDESAGFQAALGKLAGMGDGQMDELHPLRDQTGADAVSLWINVGDSCGLGYLMTTQSASFEANAFSVVNWSCARFNFSFAHELGHNLGAQHDRDSAGGQAGVFRYSYGYRQQSRQPPFRTIMSYACGSQPDCPRINRWSNPDGIYEGNPTGIPLGQNLETDNRLTLNQTRLTAARWRSSVPPLFSDATQPSPTLKPRVQSPKARSAR